MDILRLIGLGTVVFATTNIDDIFLLMMFFSDRNYKSYQVILGQYIGIGLLVGVSVLGGLASLIVPATLIGMMGFVPIIIGLQKLWELRRAGNDESDTPIPQSQRAFQFLGVTAVTFSNGGDNIGVYVPLFANSPLSEIAVMVTIFMLMVAVWCGIAFYLVRYSAMKHRIQRIGNFLLPFVLIGLGVYILVDAFLWPSITA